MFNMICPHCKEKLRLKPNSAFLNAEIYGNVNKVYTNCCNKLVGISRVVKFKVIDFSDLPAEDDWGNKRSK